MGALDEDVIIMLEDMDMLLEVIGATSILLVGIVSMPLEDDMLIVIIEPDAVVMLLLESIIIDDEEDTIIGGESDGADEEEMINGPPVHTPKRSSQLGGSQ